MNKSVYLDMCAISRPYDDQSQLRVRLETDAVLLIIAAIQKGRYVLKTSPVHFAEAGAIEDKRERSDIERFFALYGQKIVCDIKYARDRAECFVSHGIGVADAAHLAFAEAGCDVIISCDDNFVRKAKKIKIGCLMMTPVEFCEEERLK
ncbi:MAG: hypothetical protein ABR497_10090 [Kiritimatiellia bacterium]